MAVLHLFNRPYRLKLLSAALPNRPRSWRVSGAFYPCESNVTERGTRTVRGRREQIERARGGLVDSHVLGEIQRLQLIAPEVVLVAEQLEEFRMEKDTTRRVSQKLL